jgi:hypothetical protein
MQGPQEVLPRIGDSPFRYWSAMKLFIVDSTRVLNAGLQEVPLWPITSRTDYVEPGRNNSIAPADSSVRRCLYIRPAPISPFESWASWES